VSATARPVGARLRTRLLLDSPAGGGRIAGAFRREDVIDSGDLHALEASGVPSFEPWIDSSDYFNYHHTPADTFDKVNIDNLRRHAAVMATTAWFLANLDAPIGRANIYTGAAAGAIQRVRRAPAMRPPPAGLSRSKRVRSLAPTGRAVADTRQSIARAVPTGASVPASGRWVGQRWPDWRIGGIGGIGAWCRLPHAALMPAKRRHAADMQTGGVPTLQR
jgi:hypothetical protein